jgi:hypothetical protein
VANASRRGAQCNCARQKASDRNGQRALGPPLPRRKVAKARPEPRDRLAMARSGPVSPAGAHGCHGSASGSGRASQRGQREERQRSTISLAGSAPARLKSMFLAQHAGSSRTKRARRFRNYHTMVWTLPERHTIGQFLIGTVLLCSVARHEGKILIVFSKEARTWREELGTSNS